MEKIVEFEKWCHKCEHYNVVDWDYPCHECMEAVGREDSRKPEYFKDKEGMSDDTARTRAKGRSE